MIRYIADRIPREFRIRPAEEFAAIRDELRRWLKDARETLVSQPLIQTKKVPFRGGQTNVVVGFDFPVEALSVGRIEGPVSPGVAVTATATATASGRTKVWEWNGTDATQFESTHDFLGKTSGGDLTNPSLSVVSDATVPGGSILRLQVTTPGGAGYRALHWLVKQSELSLTWPNRYRWEWSQRATIGRFGGFSFLGNADTDHYFAWNGLNNNGSRHRVDAGTLINFLGGATNGALYTSTSQDGAGWAELYADVPAGAPPRFEFTARGGTGTSAALSVHLCDSGAADGQWQTSGTTVPSSWHGKACDRWGLSFVGQGAATTRNLDLTRLVMYRIGDDASTAAATATTTTEPPGLSVDWIPLNDATGKRGVVIRSISGLVTDTDYEIVLVAMGAR